MSQEKISHKERLEKVQEINTPKDINLLKKQTEEKRNQNELESQKIAKKMYDYLQGAEKYLFKTYNLSASNKERNPMALNLFNSAQNLRARLLHAQADKIEEMVGEYSVLMKRVSEFTKEGSFSQETASIDESSLSKAFPKAYDEAQSSSITTASAETPINYSDDIEELAREEAVNTSENVVDSILGETVSLDDGVQNAKTAEIMDDLNVQKENNLEEKLNIINSETEPKDAPRLLRQIWDLQKNKMGKLASIYPHSDNANLVFEYKNGSKKIVSPEAIDKFSKRSFSAFEEKYLSKLEDYKVEVSDFDFSDETEKKNPRAEEKPKEEKPGEDQFASLDENTGVNILKGKGKVIF